MRLVVSLAGETKANKNMTIYTITLTNKETGQKISRDYDLDKKDFEEFPEIISEMRSALDDNQEKF